VGTCFFEYRAFPRINAARAAAKQPLTPSIAVEEAEFALPLEDLSSFLRDMKALTILGGGFWPVVNLLIRPAGPVKDYISPVTGKAGDRFVWIEMGTFRPNAPVLGTNQPLRVQKRLPGLQEAFEQLMVCK
jgi:hypothetical protein